MISKHDVFTLPLPLEFSDLVSSPAPTAPAPERPYLNWRLSRADGDEAWVTAWHQDGLLLSARIEALEVVDPDAVEHLWRHRLTVHTYDASEEEIAFVSLDDVVGPLADLDIFPVFDDTVYLAADQCVEFVRGERQPDLLH